MVDWGCGLQDVSDLQHKDRHVVLEFGDLGCEANRIALIEAMVFDRVIPGRDADSCSLEFAFMNMPRGAMYEVVTTASKLAKAHSQRASLILKMFEDRNIA